MARRGRLDQACAVLGFDGNTHRPPFPTNRSVLHSYRGNKSLGGRRRHLEDGWRVYFEGHLNSVLLRRPLPKGKTPRSLCEETVKVRTGVPLGVL